MPQKSNIDTFGAISLTAFALLLGFNQVVIKVGNEGFQPVFFAALRSFGGMILIFGWMKVRGLSTSVAPGTAPAGLLMGSLFAAEFICLFWALDLTTVARTSVIFYSMPVWLALAAHVLIPGERMTGQKAAGLTLAFGGVVVALWLREDGAGEASIFGDVLALLAAMAWAGIALCAKVTKLREARPETQLLWQLGVSAPLLFLAEPLFGELFRDPALIHWAGLGFQIVAIASAWFLFWFWLLSIYPASSVAAFSFLSPIFGVGLGWLMLGEPVGPGLILALVLVCGGLILINRPKPR